MPHDPSAAIAGGIFGLFVLIWVGAILIGVLGFVFWIVEIVDVARREFPDQNTKILWLLVVVLAHGIGALVYYFIGKRQGWLPGQEPLPSRNPAPPPSSYSAGTWPPPPGSG
jgi:hypothetical protein